MCEDIAVLLQMQTGGHRDMRVPQELFLWIRNLCPIDLP